MQLEDYQYRWKIKPVLRSIYEDLYKKIELASVSGNTLEIGGGIGNFQTDSGWLVKSDIQVSQGLDVCADAHKLPFADSVFSNIVLFDVLHHIQCPLLFFKEAERVLITGGRIIMIEPGITPISKLLYKIGHNEPVDMAWLPDMTCFIDPDRDPYESNQAIPTILFKKSPEIFIRENPGMCVKSVTWLSILAYPLSGGFQRWTLIPNRLVKLVLRVEAKILPFIGWIMAFRIMIQLEKK